MLQSITKTCARFVAVPLLAGVLGVIAAAESHAARCLAPIGADQGTGAVRTFHAVKDGTLVGADEGVFLRRGDVLRAIRADQDIGVVRAFHGAEDGTLVGASKGLYLHRGDDLVPIGADQDTGWIYAFPDASDGILVGAANGLFIRKGDDLVPIGAGQRIGTVQVFHTAEHGTLVGANKGLFLRQGDNLVPIGAGRDIGRVLAFHATPDGTLLVGADEGLFRRHDDDLIRIGADQDTGLVSVFLAARDGALLVGTFNGVFRLEGDELVPLGTDQRAIWVNAFHATRDGTLVGADNGLFRRQGNELVHIGADRGTRFIREFHVDAGDGTLLVGTGPGLFRFVQEPWANAETASPSSLSPEIGATRVLTWTVAHPCVSALENHVELDGVREDWTKIRVQHHAGEATVQAEITFKEERDEPYRVQLRVTEDTGEDVDLGKAVAVYVGWETLDYLKYWGALGGTALLALHTAVFVLLIFGAHWSLRCWRILTDPVWGKTGLWFYFLLRHAGPLQRWILAPWFRAVRQQTSRQPYLPMRLSDDGKVVGLSTGWLDTDATPQRLWVQGNAGMGKTVTLLYLQAAFFADPKLPALSKAFAKFRCVPIVVPLREYRHVAFDPSAPENWVPSVARMAVSAFGVRFEDEGLFRAMIRSGGFLLILDGANEVERDEEIELFARSAPASRLLVTSQLPGSAYFTNWHLPRAIHDEIEPLLRLFLGDDGGAQVFARIAKTPLLNAIRSGYDVRLIADVVADQGADVALPEDRLGLYRLILETIPMPDGSKFPEELLCKAAWAMWRDGDRKLDPGEDLDEDLLAPLLHENQKVLRILDGQQFEFRHDQMRAYLAARWAACHEAHPISLFESEGTIWRLSRKEQDEVWGFFADMYAAVHADDAVALWQWSTAHPDRVILQHALQRALKDAGRDPLKTAEAAPVD